MSVAHGTSQPRVMASERVELVTTTSQTVGPYLHIGLEPRYRADVAFDDRTDQPHRIVLAGRVVDGDGAPMPDGMIEVWQADADGRYDHPHDLRSGAIEDGRSASGFGRMPTQPDGSFAFTTVKPGRVPAPDGTLQAPHIVVACFARGLLRHLSTRVYFDDEPAANDEDFVLRHVPAERRATLVARSDGDGRYAWTLVMQGPPDRETVFFDV